MQELEKLSGKWPLHVLVLPLLVLSVTFSSKPVFPDSTLHLIFSSAFVFCAIVVFYANSKSGLTVLIPLSVVLLRAMRLREVGSEYLLESTLLEILYSIPYSILMLGVGAYMLRDHTGLMVRQIRWVLLVSILLSLLQISGVQWAQSLTNFYWYDGGTTESYFLIDWSHLPELSGIQMRPVGFAHANNVVSQFLLFFYGFLLACSIERTHGQQKRLLWFFVLSFACALTGAKLPATGIVFATLAALVVYRERKRVLALFGTTLAAYFAYWLLFPGVAAYNFSVDLFVFNLALRLTSLAASVNVPWADDIVQFLLQYQTGEYLGERSLDRTLRATGGDATTGVESIAPFLSAVALIGLAIAPVWLKRLRKLARSRFDAGRLPVLMVVVSVACSGGGPFLLTSYSWFFLSFGLYPLTILLLRDPKESAPTPRSPARAVTSSASWRTPSGGRVSEWWRST